MAKLPAWLHWGERVAGVGSVCVGSVDADFNSQTLLNQQMTSSMNPEDRIATCRGDVLKSKGKNFSSLSE